MILLLFPFPELTLTFFTLKVLLYLWKQTAGKSLYFVVRDVGKVAVALMSLFPGFVMGFHRASPLSVVAVPSE